MSSILKVRVRQSPHPLTVLSLGAFSVPSSFAGQQQCPGAFAFIISFGLILLFLTIKAVLTYRHFSDLLFC